MIYKYHQLTTIENSTCVFHCSNCYNIIKGEMVTRDGFFLWYYLDYEKGVFWPLKDCNEIIIKKILE